ETSRWSSSTARASAVRGRSASPSCSGCRPPESRWPSCAAATTWPPCSARRRSRRSRVARTLALGGIAGTLIAWNWLRLEIGPRRPRWAALALLVGAGWPATLLRGQDFLRGAALLAGLLVLLVALRERPRVLGYAPLAGLVVVIVAVGASSSPALARQAFVN